MKLKDQVTSVKLSNRLHELGVKSPSIFYRDSTKSKENAIEAWNKNFTPSYCPDNVSCYTLSELGKGLPKGYIWIEPNYGEDTVRAKAKTEVNARALMLIYVIGNKLTYDKRAMGVN